MKQMEDKSDDEYYSDTYESSHDGAEKRKREAEYLLTGKKGNIQKFAGGLKHARHAVVLDMLKAETRESRESTKERL